MFNYGSLTAVLAGLAVVPAITMAISTSDWVWISVVSVLIIATSVWSLMGGPTQASNH